MSIKIPWQVWACAGLVAFLSVFGWWADHHGASRVQKRWDASIARGEVIVGKLKAAQRQVTTKIEYKYIDRIKVIHEKGDTITKLIPQYIPAGTCDLPSGFRILHDAAAANTIPSSAGDSDAAAVPVATATATITDNYTTCHAAISDLQGMREWARDQRQAYLDLCKERGVVCN